MIRSMSVERRFQVCLAATASLGTLLLGLGQSNMTLPVVAVFAAVTSVYFTDYQDWFHLNRHAANILALGAAGFAVVDVMQQELGTQLVAIANLLIYLQIILLYQKKNLRLYWHVLVLSLLQVVVAAALNLGIEFGVLLVVYMFLALISLTLLFILCETADYTVADASSNFAFAPAGRMMHRAHPEASPLAGSPPEKALTAVLSTDQPAEAMLSSDLIQQVLRLGLTTLLLTFIVFFLTPRFGRSTWRGGPVHAERLVGFTDEVRLNDIGRIRESPEKVMRVQFVTDGDYRPYALKTELYLRGSVLRDYEPYSGRWTALQPRSHDQQAPQRGPHTTHVVRQAISLEDSEILFSTMPVVFLPETPPNLQMSSEIGQIYRVPPEPKGLAGHLRYEVGSRAFVDGRQRDIVPRRYGTEERPYRLSSVLRYTRFNEEALPSLPAIARSVLDDAEVEPGDRIGILRALESHLQRLDMFRFSSELTELPPQGMDPIEHFLAESHEGHCEYFASALTLMLRSQGIPARMVVGFKGGDYNRMGHYYQIRQLHAHAWVEAFLEPEHVPVNALLEGETANEGAWMRLDPTPLDTDPTVTFVTSDLFDRIGQVTDYMQMLWNDYILGMDTDRQRKAIYKPLMDGTLTSYFNYVLDGEWRSVFLSELVTKLGVDSLSNFHRTWFNWRALPVVIATVLLLIATYLVLRRPVQRIWNRAWTIVKQQFIARLVRNRETAFYYRFERILRRHGIKRRPSQTPRELALSLQRLDPVRTDGSPAATGHNDSDASVLVKGPVDSGGAALIGSVAEAGGDIVDLFYRVRYGGSPLTAAESKTVDRKLAHVARAFSTKRFPSPPGTETRQ